MRSVFSDFTCEEGQYLNLTGDQSCRPCPAGTYSLGGGVRFDDWEDLPAGFRLETETYLVSSDLLFWTDDEDDEKKNGNCTK